jgi:hypothetical protein
MLAVVVAVVMYCMFGEYGVDEQVTDDEPFNDKLHELDDDDDDDDDVVDEGDVV